MEKRAQIWEIFRGQNQQDLVMDVLRVSSEKTEFEQSVGLAGRAVQGSQRWARNSEEI